MSLTLKKVKSGLERVLDKNLQDLVRGIRTHKNNEGKFISECLEEIKQELRQENVAVKANAIAKLTYLQMLGYDISWAAFNIIEVMSSPKFTYKRIAYLAASQCFHKDLDVLMLSTNLLRKDLNSHNYYDAGLAITSLSCFITPDLARDLGNDVVTLMNSTKPYIRKKAVLLMYKVFLNNPDALRSAFPRLREKLEDPDPGVQSAAVHVICELARRNPQNYLPLAPVFFKLMTSSVNNWVLIKIIKLFGALTPIEPRLGKKLLEPLTNLIHSTSAMSLLYECIQTVIAVLLSITARPSGSSDDADAPPPEHSSAIQLCVQKLRVLIEDADQNLKYLGLLAMSKILEAHPKPVQAHKDLILACLDDRDESIRLRALDLLHGMVSRKNLVEITRKLIAHAEKAEGSHYRDEIVAKVIGICSQSNYQFVTNFEWYISVLVELARLQGMKRGEAIAAQILDVAIRVAAVRPFAVQQMAIILQNSQIFYAQGALQPNGPCEVLYAASWICGEFSAHLPHASETLDALLIPRASQLPPHIQAVYLQNASKIYARLLKQHVEENGAVHGEEVDDNNSDEPSTYIATLNERVRKSLTSDFIKSADLEVQERASCFQALVDYVDVAVQNGQSRQLTVISDLVTLFEGELNPVAPKAQRKVPVPEGLDLDKWINEPPPEDISPASSGETEANAFGLGPLSPATTVRSETSSPVVQLSPEEMKRRREQRLAEQESNPHYLKPTLKKDKDVQGNASSLPRVQQLQGMTRNLIVTTGPASSEDSLLRSGGMGYGGGSILEQSSGFEFGSSPSPNSKKTKKAKKGQKTKKSAEEEPDEYAAPLANIVVSTAFDMPEGADLSDGESKKRSHANRKNAAPDEEMHRRLAEINLDNATPNHVGNGTVLPKSSSIRGLKLPSGSETATKSEKELGAADTMKKKKKSAKETKPKKASSKKTKDAVPVVSSEQMQPLAEKASPALNATDDLDFWLAPTATGSASAIESAVEETKSSPAKKSPAPAKKASKKVAVKSGGKKASKGSAPSPSVLHDDLVAVLANVDRNEYEVDFDSGSATPAGGVNESQSSEQIAVSTLPSGFTLLAENNRIRIGIQARPVNSDDSQVSVAVCLQNLSSSFQLKEFELTMLDAAGGLLSLSRSGKTINLPSSIAPHQKGDGNFILTVGDGALISPTLPRMRGTLSYVAKPILEGTASQEQIEFRMQVPASGYVYPEAYSTADSLQQLMTSGLLTEREGSTATAKSGSAIEAIAARVAADMHLSIVERPSGASGPSTAVALHGRTMAGDHLCLLLKQQQNPSSHGVSLSIDARASQNAATFLSHFVCEIVNLITNRY